MHGFFGKIPSHGDFITRSLSRRFLDRWDDWLQNCIAESKAQLGEKWLDVYLTSPIWRFALMQGICGPEPWAGILMPSVDRVGRYFPLTVATQLPAGAQPFQVVVRGNAWFESVEGLALRTLEDDHFEANGLQAALDVVAAIDLTPVKSETLATTADAWSLALHGLAGADVPAAMAHTLVERQAGLYSLWWTGGSEEVGPSALVVGHLPDPRSFAELLHGSWDEAVYSTAPVDEPDVGVS